MFCKDIEFCKDWEIGRVGGIWLRHEQYSYDLGFKKYTNDLGFKKYTNSGYTLLGIGRTFYGAIPRLQWQALYIKY